MMQLCKLSLPGYYVSCLCSLNIPIADESETEDSYIEVLGAEERSKVSITAKCT